MNLRDAIRRIISDGQEPTEAQRPAELVAKLKEQHGSVRAAGRALGIPESTLRRWGKGNAPSSRSISRVETAARSLHLRSIDPDKFRFVVKDRPDRDGRERVRELSAQQLQLRPGTLERMRDAHLRGDHEAAAKAFLGGVGNDWYRQWLTPGSTLAHTGMADGSSTGPKRALERLYKSMATEAEGDEPSETEQQEMARQDGGDDGIDGGKFHVESVDVTVEIDTGYGGSIVGGTTK